MQTITTLQMLRTKSNLFVPSLYLSCVWEFPRSTWKCRCPMFWTSIWKVVEDVPACYKWHITPSCCFWSVCGDWPHMVFSLYHSKLCSAVSQWNFFGARTMIFIYIRCLTWNNIPQIASNKMWQLYELEEGHVKEHCLYLGLRDMTYSLNIFCIPLRIPMHGGTSGIGLVSSGNCDSIL